MDLAGTEKCEKRVFDGKENTFPRRCFKKSESRDRSSDRGQAHTKFEGGTHEIPTERNETSYGIREGEREKERYLDLVGR